MRFGIIAALILIALTLRQLFVKRKEAVQPDMDGFEDKSKVIHLRPKPVKGKIIIPIVIPLANAMGVDPILTASAVFSGAAVGSNTCLYGDGVIMCAQGTQVKTLNLMMTTLPYACIAGGASVIAYLIVGFML